MAGTLWWLKAWCHQALLAPALECCCVTRGRWELQGDPSTLKGKALGFGALQGCRHSNNIKGHIHKCQSNPGKQDVWMASYRRMFFLERANTFGWFHFFLTLCSYIGSVLTEFCLHKLREHNLINAFFMPQEIAVAEQVPYKGHSEA